MITDSNLITLKEYFKDRNDVAFAFLFGSQTKGNATKLSDIDLAIYFFPKERHPVEYEQETFYGSESQILDDLERLLKNEVEILVLNRAPAAVATSAIKGVPLVINDWGIYIDFMEVVTNEALDFMDFTISSYMETRGCGEGS